MFFLSSLVVLEVQSTSTSPCPWTTKSLKIVNDFSFCKLSAMIVWWSRDWRKQILFPPSCRRLRRRMAYLLISDISNQVLLAVLVLEDQFTSPCPCPCQQHSVLTLFLSHIIIAVVDRWTNTCTCTKSGRYHHHNNNMHHAPASK